MTRAGNGRTIALIVKPEDDMHNFHLKTKKNQFNYLISGTIQIS